MKTPKLTPEQESTLHQFIGKCVLSGSKFKSFQAGVHSMTIQDIITGYSIDGMKDYGKKIEKLIKDSTSSVFDSEDTVVYVAKGISAEDLLAVLVIAIQRQKYLDELSATRSKANSVKAQLEQYKTPDQHKAELESQLADLEAALA